MIHPRDNGRVDNKLNDFRGLSTRSISPPVCGKNTTQKNLLSGVIACAAIQDASNAKESLNDLTKG